MSYRSVKRHLPLISPSYSDEVIGIFQVQLNKDPCLVEGRERSVSEREGIPVLGRDVAEAPVSQCIAAEIRPSSFTLHQDDGLMRPVAKDSLRYLFIGSCSGLDRL